MIGYVYWPDNRDEDGVPQVPGSVKTAMMCSTLGGTMIGQIAFGYAADKLGRRKMYGMELVVIIVGTMLLLMSSNGEKNSMNVAGWLITWRAVMGEFLRSLGFLLLTRACPCSKVEHHVRHPN